MDIVQSCSTRSSKVCVHVCVCVCVCMCGEGIPPDPPAKHAIVLLHFAWIIGCFVALHKCIPYSGKFSHSANFRVFRGILVNRENKNRENSYERTLELEDVPPSLFQDLCGSPSCASFAARRTFDAPCVSTTAKGIAEEIVFVVFF